MELKLEMLEIEAKKERKKRARRQKTAFFREKGGERERPDRRRGAFEVVGRRGSGNFANQAGSAAPSLWVSSGKTTDSRKNRA